MDPENGDIVYVLLQNRFLFKSENGGESWRRTRLKFPGPDLFQITPSSLDIDLKNSQILFAGSPGGVLKSTDGGKQWASTDCVNTFPGCGGGGGITIDSKTPQNVYAANGPLFKSTDSGATWKKVAVPKALEITTSGTGVHPFNNNLVFAGGFGTGIFRSINGGKNWVAITRELNSFAVLHIDKHRLRPGVILAHGPEQIYVSRNRGKTWTLIDDILGSAIGDLQIHPKNPDFVVVTASPSVRMSFDGGRTWKEATAHPEIGQSPETNVALDPRNQNNFYVSTPGFGIFKTTNQGRTWKAVNSGLHEREIFAMVIDPQNGSRLLAGAKSGQVFLTQNGGRSWKRVVQLPCCMQALAIDPVDSNIVYASSSSSIYKSTDGGKNWEQKDKGIEPGRPFFSIFVDPFRPQTVYAVRFGGVFISTDGAENWSIFDTVGLGPFGLNDFLVDPSDSDTLVVAGDRGVFSYTRKISAGGPVIEQISPSAARAGESVRINGRNFGSSQGDGEVSFAGVNSAAIDSWSDTGIGLPVPSGARTGPVTVTAGNKESNSHEFIVLPTSGDVEPVSGPSSGGTRVAILAPRGLSGVQFNVLFGPNLATEIRLIDPDILLCTSPPGNGTVDISIITNAATQPVGSFTYE